jgi:hypothetical protein
MRLDLEGILRSRDIWCSSIRPIQDMKHVLDQAPRNLAVNRLAKCNVASNKPNVTFILSLNFWQGDAMVEAVMSWSQVTIRWNRPSSDWIAMLQ